MKKGLLLLLSAFLLAACSEETQPGGESSTTEEEKVDNTEPYEYIFEGSSEHWQGEFVTSGTETWGDSEGIITYHHVSEDELRLNFNHPTEEIEDGTKVTYSFESLSGGGSGNLHYDSQFREGVILHRSSSEGGAKIQEDEKIKVNIEWGNKEESFELTPKNE